MAENLKVTYYRNGYPIPHITSDSKWGILSTGAYCIYDNKPTNAETYGYLYNWHTVNDARGLAPEGWHVPTDAEWKKLVEYLGGGNAAGGKLKKTALWNSPNTGATNESGFSAVPGGYRYLAGYYSSMGSIAIFWSSSEYSYDRSGWNRSLSYNYSDVYRNYLGDKRFGLSVRCVRD